MSEVERELRNLQSSFRSIHIPPNAPDSSPISRSLSHFFFYFWTLFHTSCCADVSSRWC